MSPSPSIPEQSHNPPSSSHTSIALIAASLFSFLLFVFLSIHKRPSRRRRAPATTPSPPVTSKKPSAKHKPKLWQVCLDEDPHLELTRLDGTVRNWQPITAWANHRCLATKQRSLPPRNRLSDSALHALPESVAQAWFHSSPPAPHPPSSPPPSSIPISDHRTVNVAVLVAMPSRRPTTEPIHGTTTPHHPIGSRLSYGEGQLSIGTTTLAAALADHQFGT